MLVVQEGTKLYRLIIQASALTGCHFFRDTQIVQGVCVCVCRQAHFWEGLFVLFLLL